MLRRSTSALLSAALAATLVGAVAPAAEAAEGVVRGDLPSGARYVVQTPADWNGKLLLWSLGYIGGAPGGEASAGPGGVTQQWLLDGGYALASVKPTTNGWAVEDFLRDQPDVITRAVEVLGAEPDATIAWGSSMGGLISATLAERYPDVIDAALPFCGSVGGALGMLNSGLDGSFAFKTLLAPDDDAIQLVEVTDEGARGAAARRVLAEAQASPEGRARVALAAAFAQIPGWVQTGQPRPADDDYVAQQAQQASQFMFSVFSPRQPLEQRAGGNFSWNVGVDYRAQLENSGNKAQVEALYAASGISLEDDLATLEAAPRISADYTAMKYMERNATPRGDIRVPVLTLHESGDTAPVVAQSRAYADAVAATGASDLLRQTFVDRPGHCGYSAAEQVAALDALVERLDSGSWPDTSADALTGRAQSLDAASPLNLGVAAFADLELPPFGRASFPREDSLTTGTLVSGTPYTAFVPEDWNGRAVVIANAANLDRADYRWLQADGTALVGYPVSRGWDLALDRDNATAAHETLVTLTGAQPEYSIVTGQSQGGLTTRLITQQAPSWLDGAVPACGGGAGAISMWNAKLDTAFALKTLVDPTSAMKITGIDDTAAELTALDALVAKASSSASGQARIVLAAALSRIAAVDAAGDQIEGLDARIASYTSNMALAIGAFVRPGFESTVGGAFSWNNGVDYREALEASGRMDEIDAAYAAAGADLEADLRSLALASRLTADTSVVDRVEQLATFDGALTVPVMSLQTVGDAAGPTTDENAYRSIVEHAGAGDQLRESFVKRTGHCSFSNLERVTAVQTLFDRLETGSFPDTSPEQLTATAASIAADSTIELGDARFVAVEAGTPARMWDARNWGSYDPTVGVGPDAPSITSSIATGAIVRGVSEVT
ncbi:MAG TPA: hypothetical protein VNP97_10060, partial [Microbacterium sp.]|nr:hypothetical protein [Microbacterium sp.]